MWERMKEQSWISSMRLLFSYLLILLAPVIAIVLVYFYAANSMREIQYKNANNSLDHVATMFEQQMKEIHNVSIHLGTNQILSRLMTKNYEKHEEFYQIYAFVKELPDYCATNNMVDDLYIFLKNRQYIIKPPVVAPADEFGYQTVTCFDGYSYEELMKLFLKDYTYGNLLFLEKGEGQKSMVMLQSLPLQGSGEIEGAIAVAFDENRVKELFLSACMEPDAKFFIVREDKTILDQYEYKSSGGGVKTEVFSSVDGLKLEDGYSIYKRDGISYLACVKHSQMQGWYYVTLNRRSVLLQAIWPIRYAMVGCCILAVFIGCALCFYYWLKRRGTVEQYYQMQKDWVSHTENTMEMKGSNFWNGLHLFFEQVSEVQKTIALQGDLIKPTVLRKLFYGQYAQEEEIIRDLNYARMELNGLECYVGVLSFEDVMGNGLFSSINEFRLFVRNFFDERISLHFYLYEVDSTTSALLISDDNIRGISDIKLLFQKIGWEMKENYKQNVYFGIGGPQKKLHLLSQDFADALECSEYAKYYQIFMPLTKAELPQRTDIFYFPVDLEVRLVHAVKRGTRKELEEIREEILTNFQKRCLSVNMIDHLLNLVRSTVIRMLEDLPEKDQVSEIARKLGEKKSLDEIFELIYSVQEILFRFWERENDNKNREFATRIQKEMKEGFSDLNFTLAVLAERLCMSENKLYKEFKICMGSSFCDTLEKMRIDHACELLHKKLPVKEIAVQCGYGSDYSFRRAFKRVMGMAPTDYMKGLS